MTDKNRNILKSMKLLNEVIEQYPKAISFSSGRPRLNIPESYDWLVYQKIFLQQYENSNGNSGLSLQYGNTQGLICREIANLLANDENIFVTPDEVVVTAGAQEAMLLVANAISQNENDLILISDPGYIGMIGACEIVKCNYRLVESDLDGVCTESLQSEIDKAREEGHRVRGMYCVPSCNSANGVSTSSKRRSEIYEICLEQKILIVEDNPYSYFIYDSDDHESFKREDNNDIVIYIGSFSKTIAPGLRVGYLVLPKTTGLMEGIVQSKSYSTLNTSPFTQTIVGGILIKNECSLKSYVAEAKNGYRQNMNEMLAALEHHFGINNKLLSWNIPQGGFFLHIKLPFQFSVDDMHICADKYGVIIIPLASFTDQDSWHNYVRLSFCYIEKRAIYEGVEKLKKYIDSRYRG